MPHRIDSSTCRFNSFTVKGFTMPYRHRFFRLYRFVPLTPASRFIPR